MSERLLDQRTFPVSEYPCPRCGQTSVIGWLYVNEAQEHMHTHYVCTFWPTGKQPNGSYNSTKPCGWHGWSVPEQEPPADPDVVLGSNRGVYTKEKGIREWLEWKLKQSDYTNHLDQGGVAY